MTGTVGGAKSGYRERNSTADRALEILQLFSEDRRALSGSEIAEHLGVARSTAYRYLQSLTASGFIEEAGGRFRLGPKILELARVARLGMGLIELARPVMIELAAATHQTALLTRRSGDAVVCLNVVESTRPIRISYEPGQLLALNAGAAAEVLLAWEDEAQVTGLLARTQLERYTDNSLIDTAAMIKRLRRIRVKGLAVARGEVDPDILGVAAPIFGPDGRVRAAVSVASLATRYPAGRGRLLESAVRVAARKVTERLGLMEG